MIRPLLTCALIALTGPALALSCLPSDVARTYTEAAEADEFYVVVHGRLSFDEAQLPVVDWNKQDQTPPNSLIPARLKGTSLSDAGFKQAFDKPITLNARCLGPWCAGAKSGTPYLAFLKRTDDGYVLEIDPCGGFGFAEPTPEMQERVVQCFQGKSCKPAPF